MGEDILHFVNRHNIRSTSEYADVTEGDIDEWGASASHWSVTLYMTVGGKRRQMTVPFHMGNAHIGNPKTSDVLGSLIMDAYGANASFDDWCGEYGYDTDSHRSERTWRQVRGLDIRLRRFLGDLYDEALDLEV